jgi:hypothetical protein
MAARGQPQRKADMSATTRSKKKIPTYVAEIYRSNVQDYDGDGNAMWRRTFNGKVSFGDEVIGWTKPMHGGGGAMVAAIAVAESHRRERNLVLGPDPGPGAELTGATEIGHLLTLTREEINAREADRKDRLSESLAVQASRHAEQMKKIMAAKNRRRVDPDRRAVPALSR